LEVAQVVRVVQAARVVRVQAARVTPVARVRALQAQAQVLQAQAQVPQDQSIAQALLRAPAPALQAQAPSLGLLRAQAQQLELAQCTAQELGVNCGTVLAPLLQAQVLQAQAQAQVPLRGALDQDLAQALVPAQDTTSFTFARVRHSPWLEDRQALTPL
jgi:hypothetical protein